MPRRGMFCPQPIKPSLSASILPYRLRLILRRSRCPTRYMHNLDDPACHTPRAILTRRGDDVPRFSGRGAPLE
jgi:hypothetical protein